MFEKYGVHIDFAHWSFIWDGEANLKAHVHCVIIGFSIAPNKRNKILFSSERPQIVNNINGYLHDAPNIFIERRDTPVCEVPVICKGSQPTNDGNLIITEDEYEAFVSLNPNSKASIRVFLGS